MTIVNERGFICFELASPLTLRRRIEDTLVQNPMSYLSTNRLLTLTLFTTVVNILRLLWLYSWKWRIQEVPYNVLLPARPIVCVSIILHRFTYLSKFKDVFGSFRCAFEGVP